MPPHIPTAVVSNEHNLEPLSHPANPDIVHEVHGGDQPKQSRRQALSCTNCRQRKVKCDRIIPCSACCARGHPKECSFTVNEGEQFTPISQSVEIRKLRAENQRLKERLRMDRHWSSDDEPDLPAENRRNPSKNSRVGIHGQKFFKNVHTSENIYFGAPGVSEVIDQFRKISLSDHVATVSHVIPRGSDMYAFRKVPYPFPSFWLSTAGTAPLVNCLPDREQISEHLKTFQRRVQTCSFPHVPEEITEKEINRFMTDPFANSEKHPDMLALIFAALAIGVQNGVFDACGGQWVEGKKEEQEWMGDIWIAAAMQALRLANFTSQPTLLAIQAIVMVCPYLTNSGRFLDAWTLLGTCIRLAHSIGLHRDPRHLNPVPSQTECHVRKSLWWWMLHLDQQYSCTLGRPLGISGIGDCPAPVPLTTDPTVMRISTFVDTFTIITRQILASGSMNLRKIDEFSDKLLAHYATCPEVMQFDDTWLDPTKELPPHPLDSMSAIFYGKTHNFLILLNRQRIEHTRNEQRGSKASVPISTGEFHSSSQNEDRPALRGRSRVLESSRCLLNAFRLFKERIQAALLCWTMGQQAFNASMLLALNILESTSSGAADATDAEDVTRKDLEYVHMAHETFREMSRLRIHKLAEVAAEKLGNLIKVIQDSRGQSQQPSVHDYPANDSVMGSTGMLLIEDQGLQAFRMREDDFQPLSWNIGQLEASAAIPNAQVPPQPVGSDDHLAVPVEQTPSVPVQDDSSTYIQSQEHGMGFGNLGYPGDPSQQWIWQDLTILQ